jgi:heme-degrading monooxygenase HmoA
MMYQTPYYAVVFTSTLKNDEGYLKMSKAMQDLVASQKGFLGMESARAELGITISYWRDLDSIKAWKSNPEHIVAMQLGKEKWYDHYSVRICKVEREYEF